jgi:hypothetical protein
LTLPLPFVELISQAQLRRLQMLWRCWTDGLALRPAKSRRLRHYYVALFTEGRANETRALTQEEASRVIGWLERLTGTAPPKQNRAAGTAGRRGFHERRRIRPNAAAWGALWAHARALGMERAAVERFIHEHFGALGLHGLDDLRAMADLNRVLWGLKAILRRGPRGKRAAQKPAA